MRIVGDEFEVFEHEIVNVFDGGIDFHPRQRPAVVGKLLTRLVKVVVVEMQIAKGMDEVTTCATIIVSSQYEAILDGTPRNRSALLQPCAR